MANLCVPLHTLLSAQASFAMQCKATCRSPSFARTIEFAKTDEAYDKREEHEESYESISNPFGGGSGWMCSIGKI